MSRLHYHFTHSKRGAYRTLWITEDGNERHVGFILRVSDGFVAQFDTGQYRPRSTWPKFTGKRFDHAAAAGRWLVEQYQKRRQREWDAYLSNAA